MTRVGGHDRASVPRVVHCIWMQGRSAMPPALAARLLDNAARAAQWQWELRLWDAPLIEALLREEAPLHWRRKYEALPLLHQRIDMARYALAYLRGGLVMDADCTLLQDPTAALALDLPPSRGVGHVGRTVLCRTGAPPWLARLLTLGACHVLISNAVIVATPRAAVWRSFIDGLRTAAPTHAPTAAMAPLLAAAQAVGLHDAIEAQRSTGALAFTDFWSRAVARGDALLLDASAFEPCGIKDTCAPPPSSIVRHDRALTWLPPRAAAAVRSAPALSAAAASGGGALCCVILLLLVLLRVARARRKTGAAQDVSSDQHELPHISMRKRVC